MSVFKGINVLAGIILLILSLTREGNYYPFGNIIVFILGTFAVIVGLVDETNTS